MFKQILKFVLVLSTALLACTLNLQASSHREAPLIANDPLADNTDLYAFRSPDAPNTVTIIANYVPLQLPQGGPNYYQFGENVRYEIHIDNDVTTTGDDIIYRFTFDITNEDASTFFNIRLGQQNLKTTYTLERSLDGGVSFSTLISNGIVPPPNIGPRSIEGPVGLASDYETLFSSAINTTSSGEKVFCGITDDPFFVDLGGIFDLGDAPRQGGVPKDGVSCYNVSSIAIQVPIHLLQKDGKGVNQAANILDGDFVIGVWASASRQQLRTLNTDGTRSFSGPWVQVSRLGMPLTNEAVIPIGSKDEWNARTPYNENPAHYEYFYNPELGLYMDDSQFGGAVPAFSPLRIQRNSLGAFDFGNGQDGLFGLKGSAAVAGTALDDAVFGNLLLPAAGKPRSVDLWPAFHTGVPNFPPYQLATGKGGNPLAAGKPFVNNFLPNGGDMLRLNMATPVTPRNDPAFSSEGLISAAVLGLTNPTYASSASLQFIPNMDGFPNGRRLEDDVTRIELQAVSGVVLAAIGLWYDDFAGTNPVTQDLLDVLTYSTGVEANDTTFRSTFPYVQTPWSGAGKCGGTPVTYQQPVVLDPTGTLYPPTNLTVVTDTFFLAPLTWKDNTTNEDGYIIRRKVGNQPTQVIDTVGPNVTTYTDTVLIFGKQIKYSVLAYKGNVLSAPSNLATYSLPATVARLDLTYGCYNPSTDSITWNVYNPNTKFLPFIWAQWWDPARDTLYATPGGTVQFKTKNHPQLSATFGNDNITGVWWIDQRLLPGKPNDIVFSIPLSQTCGAYRTAEAPQATKAGNVYQGKLARAINGGLFEQAFVEEAFVVTPNPFREKLRLELDGAEIQADITVTTVTGAEVYCSRFMMDQPVEVQLAHLPAGLYFVTLATENASVTRKVVKE